MEEGHRNRISVINKAAEMLKAPFSEVEEAFEYQFKFMANHMKTQQTRTVMFKRLGKFQLGKRFKGQETFDMIDKLKEDRNNAV